jgi:hypothetical protein
MPAEWDGRVVNYGEAKTMNYRFELSPDFTIERGRTTRNIKTVTTPGYNLINEVAAFIAAILARETGVLDAIILTLDGTSLPNAR